MHRRELICIGCPIGCEMEVELQEKEVIKVSGNNCKRGELYAKKECTNPTRIVSSSVRVEGGNIEAVSVKTSADIPKDKLFECCDFLKGIVVEAPVKIGDIILKNVANTGVDIIATKNIKAK